MALEQGEFWLIPPETPHSFRPSGTSASYYSVKFRAESSLRTAGRNGHPVADYHVNAIVRLLDDAGQTARLDFVSETILGQHLWCLLATLDADTGSGGQESPFLLRQKEFISHHGAAANVTRLAEEENMSLSQFKKHFRRESGGRTDIKRFIDELLIQCAVGHLIYSPGNLTEIARLMNFPLRPVEESRRDRLVLVQAEPLMAVAGVAARKKDGQTVSGDTGAWFKHDDGALYVLLCDGMGSGRLAQRESTLAVRLLEQFLRAGVRPENALRTLSSALALRGEEEIGFTTIDLLRVDLFTGEGDIYKYGAAPSYVKKGPAVSRVTGCALPAGLAGGEGGAPDITHLKLEAEDCVLLVSDGVTGGQPDQWVRDKLSAFDGRSPRELAQELIDESEQQAGAADDRTALVLRLSKR